jgi:hypothetical protein
MGIPIYKPLYIPLERYRDLLLLIYTILKLTVITYLYVTVDSVVINIIERIRRGRTSNIIIIKLIEIDSVKELRSVVNYYYN